MFAVALAPLMWPYYVPDYNAGAARRRPEDLTALPQRSRPAQSANAPAPELVPPFYPAAYAQRGHQQRSLLIRGLQDKYRECCSASEPDQKLQEARDAVNRRIEQYLESKNASDRSKKLRDLKQAVESYGRSVNQMRPRLEGAGAQQSARCIDNAQQFAAWLNGIIADYQLTRSEPEVFPVNGPHLHVFGGPRSDD